MIVTTVAMYGADGFVKKTTILRKNNQFTLACGKNFISNDSNSPI